MDEYNSASVGYLTEWPEFSDDVDDWCPISGLEKDLHRAGQSVLFSPQDSLTMQTRQPIRSARFDSPAGAAARHHFQGRWTAHPMQTRPSLFAGD